MTKRTAPALEKPGESGKPEKPGNTSSHNNNDHAQPTTAAQLAGHRFVSRQLEQALVSADTRMVHDVPGGRRRALAVGAVVAALGIAGAGIMAMIKPDPQLADHMIVASADTGQLYVRVEDTLHPVTDLASARLIVGKPEQAHQISGKNLAEATRGELIGLNGPGSLPKAGGAESTEDHWAICHTAETEKQPAHTIVTAGQQGGAMTQPAIVRAPSGLWLLAPEPGDGPYRRMLVAPGTAQPDPAVARALHLDAATIRTVPEELVEAISRTEDVSAVLARVPHSGSSGLAQPLSTLGTVISISTTAGGGDGEGDAGIAGATTGNATGGMGSGGGGVASGRGENGYYLVRENGIAPLEPVHAQLVLGQAGVAKRELSEADIAGVPAVEREDWAVIPGQVPQWAPVRGQLCAGKQGERDVVTWRAQEAGAVPVALHAAAGEGAGAATHFVGLKQAAAVDTGSGYHVIDADGRRFSVANRETLEMLGFRSAAPAPWAVIKQLPDGGELTRDRAARVVAAR